MPLPFLVRRPPCADHSATVPERAARRESATPVLGSGPRDSTKLPGALDRRPASRTLHRVARPAPGRSKEEGTREVSESTIHESEAVIDNGDVRHPHHPLRDRPAGPAGRRLRRRLPRRRHHAAVGHHGRQAPEGAVRLLPADRRRRGADVRRRAHPRLVLPPRGPPERGRDPHLPADRPPAAPDVRQGPAQRGPGRHHRHGAEPRRTSTTWSRSTPRRCPPSCPACRSPARSAASASPSIERPVGRLPDPLPAGGGRLRHGRRRPGRPGDRRRDHDGRGRGHRERPSSSSRAAPPPRPRRSSPRAWRRPSRSSGRCARRRPSWPPKAAKPTAEFPVFPDYQATRSTAVEARRRADELAAGADHRRQAGARGRSSTRSRPPVDEQLGRAVRRPRRRRSARRFRSLTKKLVRQRVLRDKVRIDGRGLTDIRHAVGRGRRPAAGARLGAVRARRDPDPGRHHAEHAPDGAAARHALAGERASATCTTTTSRRTPPVRPAGWARPSAARSATARSPSARWCPCCPTREEFPYAIRQVSEALGLQRLHLDGLGLRLDAVAC